MGKSKSGKSTITIELELNKLLAELDPKDYARLDAFRRKRKYGWERAIVSCVNRMIFSLRKEAKTPKSGKGSKAAKVSRHDKRA